MSEDDEFRISDLRRKRESSESSGRARAGAGPAAGDYESVIHTAPVAPARPAGGGRRARPDDDDEEGRSEWSVDVWRVLAAMKRHWKWLAIGAVALGLAGLAAGYYTGKYAASIKLIQDRIEGTDTFVPEALDAETLANLIRSSELARRVAEKAEPPVPPSQISGSLSVRHEKGTALTEIMLLGQDAGALVNLVNLYGEEAVAYSKELQLAGVRRSIDFYTEKVELFNGEVRNKNAELNAFLTSNNIINPQIESEAYMQQVADMYHLMKRKETESEIAELQIKVREEQLAKHNPLVDQLASAQARLASLRERGYTEQHPAVQGLVTEIAGIESRMNSASTNLPAATHFAPGSIAASMQKEIAELRTKSDSLKREVELLKQQRLDLQKTVSGISELGMQYADLMGELGSLQESRREMAAKLKEAQLHEQRAKGFYRIVNPITMDDVNTRPRMQKAFSTGVKGALAGFVLAAALVFLVEMKDRTMKTVAEVERVTGLHVLGTLGDLNKMTEAEQDKWAFRTWTIIAGQLNMSANRGMVCGVMSSVHGEGRSTWIRLLGNAASRRGLRVLTVATKPSTTDPEKGEAETEANEKSFTEAVAEAMADSGQKAGTIQPYDPDYMALDENPPPKPETLSPNVLAFPAEVTQKFNEGGLPAAHIPLPGWVWSLERRRQWQNALTHWRSVDNLVLLVELPPASVPESVLLAENLPQILWLVDSGKPRIRETKEQLEMLHHARCRIVGAVLNHEPEPIIKL